MLLILARDMQWRWRRLAAGVLATALVLAMTLLLGALRDSFLAETDRAVAFFGADAWITPDDTAGPFTSNSPIAASVADDLRAQSGRARRDSRRDLSARGARASGTASPTSASSPTSQAGS